MTRRFGDACEWPHFSQSHHHLCGHLRGIRGGGSNPHTSQQRLLFNTAARGAHRVGSWGLALGSGLADQELANDHKPPLDQRRNRNWREGYFSEYAFLVRALQSRAMLGFSPLKQGFVGEDTGLLARNSWSCENNFGSTPTGGLAVLPVLGS